MSDLTLLVVYDLLKCIDTILGLHFIEIIIRGKKLSDEVLERRFCFFIMLGGMSRILCSVFKITYDMTDFLLSK